MRFQNFSNIIPVIFLPFVVLNFEICINKCLSQKFTIMEMVLFITIAVFIIAIACRFIFDRMLKTGKISMQNRKKIKLIWNIICSLCVAALIVYFGLNIRAQWQNDNKNYFLLVVYIIFALGCIIHFYRAFKNKND